MTTSTTKINLDSRDTCAALWLSCRPGLMQGEKRRKSQTVVWTESLGSLFIFLTDCTSDPLKADGGVRTALRVKATVCADKQRRTPIRQRIHQTELHCSRGRRRRLRDGDASATKTDHPDVFIFHLVFSSRYGAVKQNTGRAVTAGLSWSPCNTGLLEN